MCECLRESLAKTENAHTVDQEKARLHLFSSQTFSQFKMI